MTNLAANLAATAQRLPDKTGIKLDAAYTPKAATVLVAPGAGPILGEVRSLPVATGVLSLDYDRGTDLSIVANRSPAGGWTTEPERSGFSTGLMSIAAPYACAESTSLPATVRQL